MVLSVARSRLALIIQLSFLGLHSVGLLLATVHSSKVPDLYENNVHSRIGWTISLVVVTQCIIGLVKLAANIVKPQEARTEERVAFLPVSTEALAQHQSTGYQDAYRYSQDSGHFTASEPSRSQSFSSTHDQEEEEEEEQKLREYKDAQAEVDYTGKQGLLGNTKIQRAASRISAKVSKRTMKVLNVIYTANDFIILPFGFIAIVTGTVVYGGVFVS